MIYLKWTASELATLDMRALYTEVDEDGWVQREVGIGFDGFVTHHLVPTHLEPGWFGNARLGPLMLASNVTRAEFESLWHAGTRGAAPGKRSGAPGASKPTPPTARGKRGGEA